MTCPVDPEARERWRAREDGLRVRSTMKVSARAREAAIRVRAIALDRMRAPARSLYEELAATAPDQGAR